MKPIDSIKRAQKESLYFRVIAKLFSQAALDDSELRNIYMTRVTLNRDKSICYVYFSSDSGREHFEKVLQQLKLYKPSLRKAVASEIRSKRIPQIVFKYDEQLEKQLKIENLIEKIKSDDS